MFILSFFREESGFPARPLAVVCEKPVLFNGIQKNIEFVIFLELKKYF